MLTEAGTPATSREAFEASLDPSPGGAVIGISHEGGTAATIHALEAARCGGGGDGADHGEDGFAGHQGGRRGAGDAVRRSQLVPHDRLHLADRSGPRTWARPAAGVVHELASAGLRSRDQAAELARELSGCERLIIVGSAADRISPASWRSRSRRRAICRARCATWRRSCTATCRRATRPRAWSCSRSTGAPRRSPPADRAAAAGIAPHRRPLRHDRKRRDAA